MKEFSCWSPYLFTGVGYLGAGDESSVSIPWGIGVKFNLYRQWSCGIEWSARKLFTGKIDLVYDPWGTGETNFIYNKDAGMYVCKARHMVIKKTHQKRNSINNSADVDNHFFDVET